MVERSQVQDVESWQVEVSTIRSNVLFGLILTLLFASGCAALIYEVVWLQQLQLIIGSSAVSLGLLLATYMGGLFLGSVTLPRLISTRHDPFRIYGVAELGTAILGLLILFGMPLAETLYVSAAQGLPNLLLRGLLCSMCLLPPTFLMGMTLPALSRLIDPTKIGVSRIGLLYGANVAGAIFGCLWAGFYLLRVYDLAWATYAAVAINFLLSLAGFGLAARRWHYPSLHAAARTRPAYQVQGNSVVYLAVGLSGLSALGAQVVWTRLLSVLFGPTVYTFSIILSVFLIGLGIGSVIGSACARWSERPILIFGICQLMLSLAIAWTAWTISKSLPYWPIDPSLAKSPWFNFQLDLFRAVWTILPATVLWGVSFPLALASASVEAQDSGRLAGEVYGANTLGAIVGAIVFSFLAIPHIGTMHSEQVLIALPCIAAVTLLAPFSWRSGSGPKQVSSPRGQVVMMLVISIAVVVGLVATVSEIPWQVIAYGRRIALMMYSDRDDTKAYPINVLYRGEGLSSSIAITEQSGLRIIYVNGNVEASNAIDDMRLERMAGQIPALVNGLPSEVLIVGFGAGITAGSFVTHPEVKKIVIAELEPLIPPASGKFFQRENYGVLNDPRTTIAYDDGRHYLLTHKESFDVITSDPVHLWVKGTSALYSKEYFEIVRRHLKPGGVIAQWLPLYDGDADTIKSVMATFFEVFPNGTVWSNHTGERGFDLVLLGQASPTKINADELQQRLNRSDFAPVANSLRAVGFKSATDILGTYLGQASDLEPWLAGTQINLDRNLRLQYLAGLEMNANASEQIYKMLLAYRRFPQNIFVGSDSHLQPLQSALSPPH